MVKELRFLIFGDSKGKEDGINKKVLRKILKESTKLIPSCEFIVLGGDNVAGSCDEEILRYQFNQLRELIKKYYPATPLMPIVGNHEVNNEPVDDKYEKIFNTVYRDLVPHRSLEGYNNTAYYLDFENTRLIVLNTFHYGEIHTIAKEQLMWFEKIASVNIKNKLVFLHSPAFPTGAHLGHCLDLYPEARDTFIKMVNKCEIDIIFCGHEHNYSRRIIPASINTSETLHEKKVWQVITGGGGEGLRDKYKSKEGVVVSPIAEYHFLVVDVENESIMVTSMSTRGRILDKFKVDKL